MLHKDILINVRKSLAASIVEICRLIGLRDDLDENDDRTFMVEVANQFLADADEIKLNILPLLCEFAALFPDENQSILLNSMIRERLVSAQTFQLTVALVRKTKMNVKQGRLESNCWCSFSRNSTPQNSLKQASTSTCTNQSKTNR